MPMRLGNVVKSLRTVGRCGCSISKRHSVRWTCKRRLVLRGGTVTGNPARIPYARSDAALQAGM